MSTRPLITVARLRELLHYEPETGIFKRAIAVGSRGCHRAGEIVGTPCGKGHLSVELDGRAYYLHRLAVLYMTGAWPAAEVDHRDTEPTNNRWLNLRDVSHQVNTQNLRTPGVNNTSGFLGVSFDAARGKFEAGLKVGDKRYRKRFATAEEAAQFYIDIKRVVHAGCTI